MEEPGAGSASRAMKWVRTLRERASWRSILVAATVIALLVVAGERGLAWQDHRQRVTDGENAAAAARAEVEGLIGVSSATSKQDLEKLLDGATAGFRDELAAQADSFRQALAKNKVITTGKVVSTGVVKIDGGRATVGVATSGTVKNKQVAKPEPRNFRLRVDLHQDGDRWLVSGLEFVA